MEKIQQNRLVSIPINFEVVIEAFKKEGITSGYFISGSSILSKLELYSNPSDVDIYFKTKEDLEKVLSKFESRVSRGRGDLYYLDLTDNPASTLFQLIGFKFGTPMEVLSGFDLNASQVYFDPEEGEIIDLGGFASSLELQFIKENINYSTLERFLKYNGNMVNLVNTKENLMDGLRYILSKNEISGVNSYGEEFSISSSSLVIESIDKILDIISKQDFSELSSYMDKSISIEKIYDEVEKINSGFTI